jgi:hypothetical protein
MVNEWLGSLAHLALATQRGIVKTLQMVLGKKFDKKLVHFPSKREARRQHPCHTPEQIADDYERRQGTVSNHVRCLLGNRDAVRRSLRPPVWRGKPQSPKSKQAYRSIGIHRALAERIRKHLNGRTEGYVFQTRLGTSFKHPRILNRVLYPLLKKLDIPRSGTHAFRHGRVSYLVECDTPVETIRAWIGHGSNEMVYLYTHLRPEFRKRILNTIPSLLSPVYPTLEVVKQEQAA